MAQMSLSMMFLSRMLRTFLARTLPDCRASRRLDVCCGRSAPKTCLQHTHLHYTSSW